MVDMLVDSDSIFKFLDLQTAKRLGCKLRNTCLLQVSISNGHVMTSVYECKEFTWTLYVSDVMILPLGGCEILLGFQWLATLGCIKWNFYC